MEQSGIHVDFELCRKIMFRAEEVMAQDKPRGPDNYKLEGYSNELVGSNIRMLFDRGMIIIRERSEFSFRGDHLRYWPTSLTEKGVRFIKDFRNEELFQEAVQRADKAAASPTLKVLERHIANLRKECALA